MKENFGLRITWKSFSLRIVVWYSSALCLLGHKTDSMPESGNRVSISQRKELQQSFKYATLKTA